MDQAVLFLQSSKNNLKSFFRNHWQIWLIYLFQQDYFQKFINKLKLFQYSKKETNKTAIDLSHSLLLNSSKIIEKLVNRQLYYGFLQFNNYLDTNQFGFCNLHSIHHALRDCHQITFVTLNRFCPLRDTNQNQLKNTYLFHIVFEVLKVYTFYKNLQDAATRLFISCCFMWDFTSADIIFH